MSSENREFCKELGAIVEISQGQRLAQKKQLSSNMKGTQG